MPVLSQIHIIQDIAGLHETDQFIVCGATANYDFVIEANDGDFSKHTFRWEQIAGPPTDLVINTNLRNSLQINLDIINNSFLDRSFRFILDEGTIRELRFEVTAFRTPTSIQHTAARQTDDIIFGSYGSVSARGRIPNKRFLRNFPGTLINNPVQECPTGTTDTALFFPIDNDRNNLVNFIVQTRNLPTDPWVNLATIPPTESFYFGLTGNKFYRVIANYNDFNVITSQMTDDMFLFPTSNDEYFIPGANETGEFVSQMQTANRGVDNDYIIINTYTVTLLDLDTCNPPFEDFHVTTAGGVEDGYIVIPTYTVQMLTLDSCDPPFEDFHVTTAGGVEDGYIRVPTYTVDNTSGGVIGG